MVFCTKCGHENVNNAVYCPECGQKLKGMPYNKGEPQGTAYDERETLQEMIHVAWNKGAIPPRKVLYFTDQTIYIAEGFWLVGGLGFGLGGLVGHAVEKQVVSDMEKESRRINFQELAAKDPNVVVIPYTEITNVVMGKKRTLLNPSIMVKTTTTDYKFTVMEGNKYKQYLKTIPTLLGDKVNVG
jgi:hypothetical protein